MGENVALIEALALGLLFPFVPDIYPIDAERKKPMKDFYSVSRS